MIARNAYYKIKSTKPVISVSQSVILSVHHSKKRSCSLSLPVSIMCHQLDDEGGDAADADDEPLREEDRRYL